MIGAGLAIPEIATRRRGGAVTAPLLFRNFPVLAAAYAAGRGLISIIGDSTTFGLGAGSGGFYGSSGGANAANPAHYLRAALSAAGVTAIDGCVVTGGRNAFPPGTGNVAAATAYYDSGTLLIANPDWDFGGGVGWLDPTPWGVFASTNGSNGSGPIGFTPGFAWDHGEIFMACTPGNYMQAGVYVGASQIGFSGWVGNGTLTKLAVSKAAGADRVDVRRITGGMTGVGAIRVWNSMQPHVQIETLGNPDWQAGNWVTAAQGYSPLTAIGQLGAHLIIINLGLNDKNYGRTVSAFKADLKAIAGAAKATGADILLAVPTTTTVATSPYHLDADWVAAIGEVAVELGLPTPIDLRAIGLTAGDFYDSVHLVGSGYRKVGEAYAVRLMG